MYMCMTIDCMYVFVICLKPFGPFAGSMQFSPLSNKSKVYLPLTMATPQYKFWAPFTNILNFSPISKIYDFNKI